MNYSQIDIELSQNINKSRINPSVQPTFFSLKSIVLFLHTQSGTLLMTAMGFSIGFTFRDFIKEFIETIVNTIIFLISKKSIGLLHVNLFKLVTSFIVLILVILLNYYIFKILKKTYPLL